MRLLPRSLFARLALALFAVLLLAQLVALAIQLTDRVIISPYAAKRLSILLGNVISEYEKRFGALGVGAVLLVVGQGILGGLRVTGRLTLGTDPADMAPNLTLALVHGVLGQVVFASLVVLAVVTANEIVGPLMTRVALSRAGEVGRDRLRLIDFLQEEHIVTGFRADSKEAAIEKVFRGGTTSTEMVRVTGK